MWLVPSPKQWRMWSLPSKLTVIGAYLGFAGVMLAITPLLITSLFPQKQARLTAELHLMIGGYRMRVVNAGGVLAQKVNVQIVSWSNHAPDATIWIDKPIKDLMPKSDYFFDVDLLHHGGTTGAPPNQHRASSSGYILVTCNNCDKARAWAFYIPEEWGGYKIKQKGTSWPIVEFNYPEDKPNMGEVVNYPGQFDSDGWNPKVSEEQ